jgi:hypothetical protein
MQTGRKNSVPIFFVFEWNKETGSLKLDGRFLSGPQDLIIRSMEGLMWCKRRFTFQICSYEV